MLIFGMMSPLLTFHLQDVFKNRCLIEFYKKLLSFLLWLFWFKSSTRNTTKFDNFKIIKIVFQSFLADESKKFLRHSKERVKIDRDGGCCNFLNWKYVVNSEKWEISLAGKCTAHRHWKMFVSGPSPSPSTVQYVHLKYLHQQLDKQLNSHKLK
jgi:hypothetical protein